MCSVTVFYIQEYSRCTGVICADAVAGTDE